MRTIRNAATLSAEFKARKLPFSLVAELPVGVFVSPPYSAVKPAEEERDTEERWIVYRGVGRRGTAYRPHGRTGHPGPT